MMTKCFRHSLAFLLVLPLVAGAQQKQRFATLEEALASGAALNGRSGPRSVNWIDDGARFSFIDRDAATNRELIKGYDPVTGRDTVLFTAEGLTFPGTSNPFAYDAFQWADDSKHLVFQSNFKPLYRNSGISDYYVYALADRRLQLATRGARTGELSPNGALLGFEKGGNMYVTDLSNNQEKQLTSDASENVYNGHFDWVYEEEFGMGKAWKWSPDSRRIAYWQLDETAEPVSQFSDLSGDHPTWTKMRVPLVGDPNPKVRIGVVEVKSGKNLWLDTGEQGDFYIPRIYWTGERDTIAVMTLNRAQNEMKLFFFDVNTGGRRLVMSEKSNTWLDVYDFYAGIQDMISFPEGSRQYFWISDRDGWQHVYRYDYSGKLINQVTRGKWSVTRIEGIDPKTKTIYYSSTQASPLQRQLYSVRFDGTGGRAITTTPGTHSINMSPNAQYFIDRWSSLRQPRQVELWSSSGRKLRTMESNSQVTQWVAAHEYSTPEIFTFKTSDGVSVDGSIMKPVPFDPAKRHPVVFAIYGGPGSQQVYDQFQTSGLAQWLAQQGYVVVALNNRGTNNYGSAFMKVVYKQLGKYESRDFAEASQYLDKLPYVDPTRTAIMGTSYGGYSAVIAMELYPEVFEVGVSNSAVGDWRLYDSIYTEHYMGLLADNKKGYDESSPILNAPKLKGHLMLIHALMDENVHPANTMQLLTAFANAGKDVEVRFYPPGRHGSAYSAMASRLIARATDSFLARWFKGEIRDASLPAVTAAK
jgi:dipeptidyl-peptidase-4